MQKNRKNEKVSFQSIKNIVCRQNASNHIAILQFIPELNKFQCYDFFQLGDIFSVKIEGPSCLATVVQC